MILKNTIFIFLICIIAIYFCAEFLFEAKYVIYIKPLFTSLLLIYVFLDKKKALSNNFYIFH